MASPIELNIETRESAGKNIARGLRKENKIPVIIYGGKRGELKAAVSLNEFIKIYQQGGLLTKLLALNTGKEQIKAITKEVQVNAISDVPIHADFQEVSEGTLVKINVPVHVTGEDKCPGLKRGGVLNVVSRYILCNCHPESIPEYIEIDVSGMEIGQNKHIQEINLQDGIFPLDKSNFTLVSISGRVEEAAPTEGEDEDEAAAEEDKDSDKS